MDPDTREREGTNVGKNKRSTARRRNPGRGNDNPEVAGVSTLARHPTEIRGREYAARNAQCELGVGIANTSTDNPQPVGW